jgi:GNAT superfamily N-acetyltransferase
MADPVTVRPLAPTDAPRWRALWSGYLAFYDATLPEEVHASTWARLHDPAEPIHGLVAVRDGRAIGLAHYLFHRHGWHVADACYLQDLYVETSARQRGAGRALIEAVYAAADAAGAATVYWTTAENNRTARALYDRVGVKTPFVKYARR